MVVQTIDNAGDLARYHAHYDVPVMHMNDAKANIKHVQSD